METSAVRIYGENDLRLDTFALPEISDDEILAMVVSDSICMSTYKLAKQGQRHKRAPKDLAQHPAMVGHEFAGIMVQIGKKWQSRYQRGQAFALQPLINSTQPQAVGYSYPYIGGDATYVILPAKAMENDMVLPYTGRGFYKASLSEPISCIINAFQACFHNEDNGHVHKMGIKENGKVLIVGGCGPMGLGAIAYALVCPQHPSQIVVSDIDPDRIERARRVLPEQKAEEKGIELNYVHVQDTEDPAKLYSELSGGQGFDDVFVLAPETDAAQHAAQALGADGCLHFFAGPQQSEFIVPVNLYDVHYNTTHYVGTSGGTKEDMKQALELFADDQIDPAVMVSHIGGLDAVIETTKQLPALPGAKKLIYPHIQMPLTAIEDLKTLAQDNVLFAALAQSVQEHNGLWNEQAERILLEYYGVNV